MCGGRAAARVLSEGQASFEENRCSAGWGEISSRFGRSAANWNASEFLTASLPAIFFLAASQVEVIGDTVDLSKQIFETRVLRRKARF